MGTSSPARTQVSWGGNRSLSKQLRAPSRGGVTRVRIARTESSTHAARPPPSLGCSNLPYQKLVRNGQVAVMGRTCCAVTHTPGAGRVPRRSGAEIRGPSERPRRLAAGRACFPGSSTSLGNDTNLSESQARFRGSVPPAPLCAEGLLPCRVSNLKYSSRSSCSWRVPRRCRAPLSRPCGRCSPRTGCRSPSTWLPYSWPVAGIP